MLESLRSAVDAHHGEFLCEEIHHPKNTRRVPFRHIGGPAKRAEGLPDIPGLQTFYETWSELTLYVDEESGDAAYFIAPPSQWSELEECFAPWLEHLDDDERDEYLPEWINQRIVIGEVPHSGNYLLLPTHGPEAGKVFEFEHDGFEFIELGDSLADFVLHALNPDSGQLTAMASHLRFISGKDNRQWWINELRDNRGKVVRTQA